MMELINGDCREVLPTLDLSRPYVLVSDPPFNIGYHYEMYRDRMKQDDYDAMLMDVFGTHPHVLIHYPEALYRHAISIGQVPDRVVRWVYPSNTARQHRDIAYFGVQPDFRKMGQDYKNPTDKRIARRIAEGKRARLYDWWEINQVKNTNKEKTAHPCQMPVEVMRRVIGVLPSDVLIIDPFMGTGTTGLAARELGFDFVGIELDPSYYATAQQRLT